MKSMLFALVIVFNQTPTEWQEEIWVNGIDFVSCDKAQRAIWSQDWAIVGYDANSELREVDAYCIEANKLNEKEFSHLLTIDTVSESALR